MLITPFSDNYQVNIGEKVAIPCIASGVPKPEIVWTRIDSQSNETSSLNVQGGILSLENAKVEKIYEDSLDSISSSSP